jgi:hypothetical protein
LEKNGKYFEKITYELVFSGEFSRSARLFRSATAYSSV